MGHEQGVELSTMQHFWRTIFRGLMAVLPVAATLYLALWLALSMEWVLGLAVKLVLPDAWYWPGMGLVLGIGLLYGVGWLVDHWLLRWLLDSAESVLHRVPVVSKILSAVKDLMLYFSGEGQRKFNQVVSYEVEAGAACVLGLVTRDDLRDLPEGLRCENRLAVYIPGSYQIGGFTLMIARDRLTPVDMSVEEALRFAVTGAVSWSSR
jgi:uncharacterized membrane protein